MKKLAVLFFLLPVILISCHTPPLTLSVKSNTHACTGGPCTVLFTGAIGTKGSGSNQGAHSFSASAAGGATTSVGAVGSGPWSIKTQGSCHNGTFPVTLAAGQNTTFCACCGTGCTCTSLEGSDVIPLRVE